MSLRLLKVNPGCFESDDESIVYGDQSIAYLSRRPDEDSQPTQSSQPPLPHTSAHTTNTATPTKKTTPRMIMTREERRTRRRVWRERQDDERTNHQALSDEWSTSSVEEEDDDETLDQGNAQTTEDAFASLQALLQEDASVGSTSDHGVSAPGRDKATMPTAKSNPLGEETLALFSPADENRFMTAVPKVSARKSQTTPRAGTKTTTPNDASPEPSPPDFAGIVQDDDFGDDDATTNTRVRPWPMTKLQTYEPVTLLDGDLAKRPRSSSPPTSDRPTKQWRTRRHSSFHHPTTHTAESYRSLTTQLAQDDSNIVGLRPTHWSRPVVMSQLQNGFLRSAGEQSQVTRRKALRAATLRPSSATTTTVPQQPQPPHCSKNRTTAVTKENRRNNASTPKTSASGRFSGQRFTTERLRTMSFRPPTMPKQRNEPIPNLDDVSVADNDDPDQSRQIINGATTGVSMHRPAFSTPTPPRRHRSSKSHGPWTKRLAALKSNQATDALKLQHSGMNRHGLSFFDLNDPRRKAKAYTDVTILGQQDCYGTALPSCWSRSVDANTSSADHHNEGLLTVLCYIHNHGPMNRGKPVTSTISKVFGWISFTRTTARNIGLQQGLDLRLYDSILLPMRSRRERDSTSNTIDVQCRFIAICTQLCERHPEKLDPVFHGMSTAMLPLNNSAHQHS